MVLLLLFVVHVQGAPIKKEHFLKFHIWINFYFCVPVFTAFVRQDPRMFLPKYEVMKHFASHFTEDLLKYSFYKNNRVKNGSKNRFSNGTAVATEGVGCNVFYAS